MKRTVLVVILVVLFLVPIASAQDIQNPELVADLGSYELWAIYEVPMPMSLVLLSKTGDGNSDIATFPSVHDQPLVVEGPEDLGNGYQLYDIQIAQPGFSKPDQSCVIVVGEVNASMECILASGEENVGKPVALGPTHSLFTWIVTTQVLEPRGCVVIIPSNATGTPLIQCPLL